MPIKLAKYRVILKEVSFGIFRIILVSKEENDCATESKDNVLSLSYLCAISFHDIWSLSKSSKLDISEAISAKKIMI